MTLALNTMDPRQVSARAFALLLLMEVIIKRRSLTDVLETPALKDRHDQAFIKQLCFGTLRFHERLQWQVKQLLAKALKANQAMVHVLLLLALYQLQFTRAPSHATVSAMVEVVREVRQNWAVALVNGVLRQFLRQQQALSVSMSQYLPALYSHPAWLVESIQKAWPEHWRSMLEAGLQQAPLTLRVNTQHMAREAYLAVLNEQGIEAMATHYSPVGVCLHQALPVERIPGFAQGWVSVQDEAAQLAAGWLACQAGQRVLDACAAPGGKSGHVLESASVDLTALDIDSQRCQRINSNLQRLQLQARVLTADAAQPQIWWDQQGFDRILLDAPCSATGIVRRQPDIKYHRQADDIAALAQQQHHLLQSLWPTLKPGGVLLYATCSVLPQENQQVIEAFLQRQQDAELWPIDSDLPSDGVGIRIPSGYAGMDGFYYARLRKQTR